MFEIEKHFNSASIYICKVFDEYPDIASYYKEKNKIMKIIKKSIEKTTSKEMTNGCLKQYKENFNSEISFNVNHEAFTYVFMNQKTKSKVYINVFQEVMLKIVEKYVVCLKK